MLKVENTQAKRVKAKLVSRRYRLSLSERTGGLRGNPEKEGCICCICCPLGFKQFLWMASGVEPALPLQLLLDLCPYNSPKHGVIANG